MCIGIFWFWGKAFCQFQPNLIQNLSNLSRYSKLYNWNGSIELKTIQQFNNLVFWIILYFFLLTIFFPIFCTNPNDLKFVKHVANFPWRMKLKEHHQHRPFFSHKYDLVKCSCPTFCRAKKKIFANSNSNIL